MDHNLTEEGLRVMANSGSGYSCEAPADFQLSSSIEDTASRFSSTLEKCPLCNNARKTFYCKQCIQNGDFFHSNHRYAERFGEKQLHYLRLKNERRNVEEECKKRLERRLHINKMRVEVAACKDRVRLMRLLVADKRQSVIRRESLRSALSKQNLDRNARLPKYEERVGAMHRQATVAGERVDVKREALSSSLQELQRVVRRSVRQLQQFIFPISVMSGGASNAAAELAPEGDTVTALADASRTTYERGRWVTSGGELQHRIVAPTLPASGDYSAYSAWVATNKDMVPGTEVQAVETNPAFTIGAALTFSAQLVNVLAFYLDVRLPHKLCYSDFCGHELGPKQFARRVAKLNANVLHLCFSQNVSPELLQPTRTLHNVLMLLDPRVSDLGRQGPLEVDARLAASLEGQLGRDLELDGGSDSEDSDEPWEWEAVPRGALLPAAAPEGAPSNQQATSMAGGLVTSAAASLASFWRGWTGHN